MLSALLLAGLFAAPIATVALFVPATGRAQRAEERSKWIARLAATLAWAAILIAVVVAILALIGRDRRQHRRRRGRARARERGVAPRNSPLERARPRVLGDDHVRVLPLWFATACDASARRLAANWWRNVLGSGDRAGPLALGVSGNTINGDSSPLTLLAGAAAAAAAGDDGAAHDLSTRAAKLALRSPTYYGDAWAALGPALLERSIDPCTSV
jgi:hypothetical protein